MKTVFPWLLFFCIPVTPVFSETTGSAARPPATASGVSVEALAEAVAPLKNPALAGAKACVERLNAIAAGDRTGGFQRLSDAIRQVYTAEVNFLPIQKQIREQLEMAEKKRLWAEDYRRPSALGSIREESALRCLEEEKECRAKAAELAKKALPEMAQAIQAMDFHLSRLSASASGPLLTLVQAMHAVKARTIPAADIPLIFSAHWLALKRMSPAELEDAQRQAVLQLGEHFSARYQRCHDRTDDAWTFTGLQSLSGWSDASMREPLETLLPDAPPALRGTARSFLIAFTEDGLTTRKLTLQTSGEALRGGIDSYLRENSPGFTKDPKTVESLARIVSVIRDSVRP
ncbi:MAG: hypothetical protein V4726_25120 [Verrucomicrobiota bacterium]